MSHQPRVLVKGQPTNLTYRRPTHTNTHTVTITRKNQYYFGKKKKKKQLEIKVYYDGSGYCSLAPDAGGLSFPKRRAISTVKTEPTVRCTGA